MSPETGFFIFGQVLAGVLMVPAAIPLMSFDPLSLVAAQPPQLRSRLLRLQVATWSIVLCALCLWGVLAGVNVLGTAIAMVALVALFFMVRWSLRRYVWDTWRSGYRSHRFAAIITSFVGPGTLALIFAAIPGLAASQRAILLITAVATITVSYAFALFLFRWIGGEYDPPATRGYRRRP